MWFPMILEAAMVTYIAREWNAMAPALIVFFLVSTIDLMRVAGSLFYFRGNSKPNTTSTSTLAQI